MPIANLSNTECNLTADEAVLIFSGKLTQWPDGTPITLVILPREHSVSREFIMDYLLMTPTQFYDSINNSVVYRKNVTIIRVSTEEEVIKQVSRIKGSIGYTSTFVYYNHKNEIKKIHIEY